MEIYLNAVERQAESYQGGKMSRNSKLQPYETNRYQTMVKVERTKFLQQEYALCEYLEWRGSYQGNGIESAADMNTSKDKHFTIAC